MRAWADDMVQNGDVDWSDWSAQVEQVRREGAQLLAADEEEVALVRNTTEGISLVAEGFPWRAGDNVVTFAGEFPSNRFPWMNLARRDVEVRTVETDGGAIDWQKLDQAIDGRTQIVAVSWVGFATGYRQEVARLTEFVHLRGARLFLDAIQGLGVFPLEVHEAGIDYLAADGHKWLLGPEGAGLLYVRAERLNELAPLGIGWNSVVNAGDYSNPEMKLKPTAARYEGGSYNVAGLLGLGASLKLLNGFARQEVATKVLELTDLICEEARRMGGVVASCRERDHASSIVSLDLPGKPLRLARRAARERGVAINLRAGKLRISPHAYNNAEDVARLIEVLKEAWV
jgi:selenocysteine lyase/cysteine desulfurase